MFSMMNDRSSISL